jgi:hypothetical protein
MNCPSCFQRVDDDAQFCGNCGRKMPNPEASEIVLTVGRSDENTIVIDEEGVSTRHAVLRIQGQTITLEDLDSTNGTYVEGGRVMIAAVARGQRVTFGKKALLDWYAVDQALRGRVQPPPHVSPPPPPPSELPAAKSRPPEPPQNYPPSKPPAVMPQQSVHAGLGGELAYAMHANKSFTGKAFLTLLMYYIGFWLVGFIMNIIFLSEAKRTQAITQMSPPGKGCLVALLVFHLIVPLLILFLIFGVGLSIFSMFR